MKRKARFYDFRTLQGNLAGSVWADEITTRFCSDSPYETAYGTFFWHAGILAATVWSESLTWRAA